MKKEQALRRRLRALGQLSEAVGAMKSLAALHFRAARAALSPARDYREGIERLLACLPPPTRPGPPASPGLLLVAADLGLCGDYNSRMAQAALDAARKLTPAAIYCVGRRARPLLARAGLTVSRLYPTPTGTAHLTSVLLDLAEDMVEEYSSGFIGSLYAVSARFEGAGRFTPVTARVLPLTAPLAVPAPRPSPYVSRDHLAAVLIREHLYIVLFETMLDSLAAEHSARLVATQSAGEWLDERLARTRRALNSVRRERTTQEVLEAAGSARMRRAAG